ncbi:hypothetical protein BG60_10575 [Caballeronia zhejiangensis]|uniref:Uncharacterized protein n=1 Tax=Caballeronia zhejiangensis TaxID=871203 RepID=A0A656QJ61_9BURK|nr:hypothetical protein BG60_10575 [Caballeronia zhejiangensis]
MTMPVVRDVIVVNMPRRFTLYIDRRLVMLAARLVGSTQMVVRSLTVAKWPAHIECSHLVVMP